VNLHTYRWRLTRRALCLFDGSTLVGELVRLEGGEWSLTGYEGTTQPLGTHDGDRLAELVRWAEGRLASEGVIEAGASVDRRAVEGGQGA